MFAYGTLFCALSGLGYILGVIVYVSRIPERLYPGKFDIWGHSHQIWHFFVLSAAILHYVSSLINYHVRMELECSN